MFTRYAAVVLVAMQCAPREAITDRLEGQYGERQVAIEVQSDFVVSELWASDEGGTWTILVTTTNGVSCVARSGRGWQAIPEKTKAV